MRISFKVFIELCWIVFGVISYSFSFAQCPLTNNTLANLGAPFCDNYSQLSIPSGTNFTMTVANCAAYEISTCNTSFDTQLSAYNSSGLLQFYNNDNGPSCSGTQASQIWVSTFTGTLKVQVNEFDCQSWSLSSQSAILQIRQISPVITSANEDMCPGESRTLTANQACGAWSGVGISGNIFTAPNNPGNYTISYTLGACTATQIIHVDYLQDAIITLSDSIFCDGDTISLSSSSASGNLWSTGETEDTIYVTDPGNYILNITEGMCHARPDTAFMDFTTIVAEITIDGGQYYCAGDTLILTSSGFSGNSWNTGDTTSTILVSDTGTYVLQVFELGCLSSPDTVKIEFIYPYAEISLNGDSIFCNNDSTILVSSFSDGNLWSTGETTNSIIVTTEGNYSLEVTQEGCTSLPDSTFITVIGPPQPVITFNNDTLQTISDDYQYYWFYNNNLIAGATGNTYYPTQNGNYTVIVVDINGCQANSDPFTLTGLGIEGSKIQNTVSVFPNPTKGQLQIEFSQPFNNKYFLAVYDVLGSCIKTEEIIYPKTFLNLTSISSGIYFMKVFTPDYQDYYNFKIEKINEE